MGAHIPAVGWAELAGRVAFRRFNLDDVGTEIAKLLGSPRPHNDRRAVNDSYTLQWSGHGFHPKFTRRPASRPTNKPEAFGFLARWESIRRTNIRGDRRYALLLVRALP